MASETYPVKEIALYLRSRAPLATGAPRAQEGDIIEVRDPSLGIGLQEAHDVLWLLVEGLKAQEFSFLKEPLTDPLTERRDDKVVQINTLVEKHRYSIPLERLAAVAEFFDIARARDVTDPYQPFLPIDLDDSDVRLHYTHLPGTAPSPQRFEGLVFDKASGMFL